MAIKLNKRSGQNSELSENQVDSNWTTIETAVNDLQAAGVGVGTVTSVDVSNGATNLFTTTVNNPTTTPQIVFTETTATANKVLASPDGSTGTPNYRSLVANDLPTIPISKGGTNSTTALGNNKVIVSTAGAIVESSVSTTALGYISTATSDIQTQLNGKEGIITILSTTKGGTGVNGSAASNGKLLIGNGTGYTLANITAGTGVSVTNGSGTITIANTGVSTLHEGDTGGNATGGTITLAHGTSGTDVNYSASGTTFTINIPNASSTARGLITNGSQTIGGEKSFTDQATFSSGLIDSTSTATQIPYMGASKQFKTAAQMTYDETNKTAYLWSLGLSGGQTITAAGTINNDMGLIFLNPAGAISLDLPKTTDVPFKMLFLKNVHGSAIDVTLNAQTGESVEFASSLHITTKDIGYIITNDGSGNWYIVAKYS